MGSQVVRALPNLAQPPHLHAHRGAHREIGESVTEAGLSGAAFRKGSKGLCAAALGSSGLSSGELHARWHVASNLAAAGGNIFRVI